MRALMCVGVSVSVEEHSVYVCIFRFCIWSGKKSFFFYVFDLKFTTAECENVKRVLFFFFFGLTLFFYRSWMGGS